jgi:MFS family permease
VGLAVGAPALTALLGRPLGGRLADRWGPRTPLMAGAAIMAVGAVPAALEPTLAALVGSRLAVGAGEGLMMASAVLWLLRLAGESRRGRALGHIGLANYAGLALGPLLADALGGAGSPGAVLWLAVAVPIAGALAGAGAPDGKRAMAAPQPSPERASTRALLALTGRAGVGLLLVNVGYVAVLSFGAELARARGTGVQALVVPVFAAGVVVSRTLGGGVPDRLGGRRTVLMFAGAEAIGLVVYAIVVAPGLAVAALVALAVGQALAVPGLGLLALARVPARRQGAAAGLFFAWFDGGVGLGGPAVGAVASAAGPEGALIAAGVAVAGAAVIANI